MENANAGTVTQKPQRSWHDHSAEAALAALKSTPAGLSESQVQARLETYGPNRLPEPHRRSVLMRFLLQFHNILIYVLLGSAVITMLLDHMVDTLVILAVVIANAIIGFIQEGKAEQAMNAIRQMLAPHASVLRGGERRTIEGEKLVPGDIVLLEAGDKVPADLRLLQTHGVQMQEAILTGESLPVEKQTQPVAADAALGDRSCMAFSGTLVASGQGKGVVVATGATTEIGRISGMLSAVETLTTPLVEQMDVFAKWLTILILLIAALLLAFGYFLNNIVEQDHRAIKKIVRPMLGFKAFRCARIILAGFEVMHMIKKGQLDCPKAQASSAANQFYSLAF